MIITVLPSCIIYISISNLQEIYRFKNSILFNYPVSNSSSRLMLDTGLLRLRAPLISVWSRWKRAWNYLNAGIQSTEQYRIKCTERRIRGKRKKNTQHRKTWPNNERKRIFFDIRNAFETNAKLKTAEFDEIVFVCLKSRTKC